MPKYFGKKTFTNDSPLYEELFEKRGVDSITQYTIFEFNKKITKQYYTIQKHIWSKGDRLYKLANQYYGSTEFWWIIALWNSKPTDADYNYGTTVQIPFPPMQIYREIIS